MYDREVLVEKLKTLLEALERIPRRFSCISEPSDFYGSDRESIGWMRYAWFKLPVPNTRQPGEHVSSLFQVHKIETS